MTARPHYDSTDPLFAELVDISTLPEVIAQDLTWAEGPVWLANSLFFSDIPKRRMLRWIEGQSTSVALADSEFNNGNTTDLTGAMVSCVHGLRHVVRRPDPDKLTASEVIADSFEGKRLNSPNDVVVSSDGAIWFTDPPYGIVSDYEGYSAESEIGANYVYRIDPANGTVAAVATDFDKPNGLAFSPDEKLLYIADSGAAAGWHAPEMDLAAPHHVRVFEVAAGNLKHGRVFADITPGVPDGLRVDVTGNLWISAHDGIQCYRPDGSLIGRIVLPEPTANCCFGGPHGTDLFITSSSCVYRVRTSRKGAESLRKTNS